MKFSANEWQRYTRHIQLPQIGAAGQTRLKDARVLIVGAGGLGSPVSLYLAAAGVGQITLIDGDTVDLTNLQRQIIFDTKDIGKSKALVAREKLLALNPDIVVNAVSHHLDETAAEELIQDVDLVLDCTDNFTTRYLINDSCHRLNKPWVFASIFQFSGQCALFTPAKACFRCLFPEAPEDGLDCNSAGVLGVLPGLLGTFQANEALKYLAGMNCELENKLLIVEALAVETKKIRLAQNPDCPCCGSGDRGSAKSDATCGADLPGGFDITAAEALADKEAFLWLDVRTVSERSAFHIGGKHIPLDSLNETLNTLDKNTPVLCYCQSGMRSQKAVDVLRQSGFKAKGLQGGLASFVKALDATT